jgi:hypothetical protein
MFQPRNDLMEKRRSESSTDPVVILAERHRDRDGGTEEGVDGDQDPSPSAAGGSGLPLGIAGGIEQMSAGGEDGHGQGQGETGDRDADPQCDTPVGSRIRWMRWRNSALLSITSRLGKHP